MIFELLQSLVDYVASAKAEELADLQKTISQFIELARSDPKISKAMLAGVREILDFLRSADFRVWLTIPKDVSHLRSIALNVVRTQLGSIREDDNRLEKLWANRMRILEEFRRRLREEVSSYVMSQKRNLLENRK